MKNVMVVDEAVDAPEGVQRPFGHLEGRGLVGYVGGDRECTSPLRFDLFSDGEVFSTVRLFGLEGRPYGNAGNVWGCTQIVR